MTPRHPAIPATPPADPAGWPGAPFRIGIDARKLGDYGIGDYIWNLLVQLSRLDPVNRYVLFHQAPLSGPHPGLPPAFPPGALWSSPPQWIRDDAPKYSLREQVSLPWLSWRHGLDLLHCPHYVTPLVRPCPLVVTIHDIIQVVLARNFSPIARAYARFMLRRAVSGARRIITVSEGSRRDLIERLGAHPDRITVIPNGLPEDAVPVRDPARLAAVRARHGIAGQYLLFVGNVRMRHKNVVTLLRAFRLLRERRRDGLTLVLAGGAGSAGAELMEAAGPAWPDVRMTGFVERADLPALYSGAEVFVWPSLYEGFGFPPLEAMACGTPVVSSAAPVMPEVLGDAALFVPPLEPEAYASAIQRVLEDGGLRASLIARGTAQAARYTWADAARRTLAVYGEALAEAGR
jgi:glycosyltransferase involved in cell wall biosynthesis